MGIQDVNFASHKGLDETSPALAAGQRHARCDDYHNAPAIFPWEDTPFTGMWGATITAWPGGLLSNSTPTIGRKAQVTQQYDLYFKCHSGYTTQPLSGVYNTSVSPGTARTETIPAQQVNLPFTLNTANSSFKPIFAAGKNKSLNINSSLAGAGLSSSSVLVCTDCHNNDIVGSSGTRGPSSNYTGVSPTGPHGSSNRYILRAKYNRDLTFPRTDYATQNGNADLCWTCHDQSKLLYEGNMTNFYGGSASPKELHNWHILSGNNPIRARCPDCHYNIHGNAQAKNTQYAVAGAGTRLYPYRYITTALINFAPHITRRQTAPVGSLAEIYYRSYNTTNKTIIRECWLTCHNGAGNVRDMANDFGGGAQDTTYSFNPLIRPWR